MDMKLELVPLSVSDVDRSKAFYVDQVGFVLDHDVSPMPGMRIVQLTPPSSACSILLSTGLPGIDSMSPGGSRGLHLVVPSIEDARAGLIDHGVEVGPIVEDGGGVRHAHFEDPDGNGFELQEMAWRAGAAF